MNISDQLLAALVLYGLPVLFGLLLFAAIGVPLPASLLLVAAGSFVEQGALDLWWVLGLSIGAAVAGDQIGYMLGRRGGRPLALRISRRLGGADRLVRAEAAIRRWGGLGIFLSRWLLSPLGPAVNLACGIAVYPWLAFLFFDLAGEVVWVAVYVTLGRIFSDRVQALSALLGDAVWVIIGLVAVVVLAWKLVQQFHAARVPRARTQGIPSETSHSSIAEESHSAE